MVTDGSQRPRACAHVVVLGNEKGGSGKSTTALHVAVGLMNRGQRVATIDLDSRQRSLTRYIENRRVWARRTNADLKNPTHYCIARGEALRLDENEATEFSDFAAALAAIERLHDFVVIDTPGSDTYLMRLAHSMADTLVTPLNDSFLDLDVLGVVDPETLAVTGESHYAAMVREARRHRRDVGGTPMDWVVIRNRLSALRNRNRRLVGEALQQLAGRLGFRCGEGLAERVIYRELFPRGLTALDPLDQSTLGVRPSLSHVTGQQEVAGFIDLLRLPFDRDPGLPAASADWFAAPHSPVEVHDIVKS